MEWRVEWGLGPLQTITFMTMQPRRRDRKNHKNEALEGERARVGCGTWPFDYCSQFLHPQHNMLSGNSRNQVD